MKQILRTLLGCLFALWLISHGTFAQTDTSAAPATNGAEKGLKQAVGQASNITSGLISSALSLSHKVSPDADKLAFALAVITLTLAGFRFMGAMHPIGAWVGLIETITVVGIFVAIYLAYDSFSQGLYEWFKTLAASLSGSDKLSAATTLAVTAGKLWDSVWRVIRPANCCRGSSVPCCCSSHSSLWR